ncbi:MAG: hypothetical protein FWE84_01230 [Firmicutes bacterium]|nr:hypothetical protein [Bacillota bacterium]
MTLRDCIIKAAGYLGLRETADAYKSGSAPDDGFLAYARDVVAEICADYYPLKIAERVTADENGLIPLNELSKPVIDVFRVIKNGFSALFLIKYDRIEVNFGGECTVEYSYMPVLSGLDSELPFSSRIDERVVAYGIAAEYALLNCPEDAAMFDKRYKDALSKALIQKSEKRVKGRSWL